jgi:D-alanine-D-alanine ligase
MSASEKEAWPGRRPHTNNIMNVVVAHSAKEGLVEEMSAREEGKPPSRRPAAPEDFFAEGDSRETIDAVINALRAEGHRVTGIEADNSAFEALRRERPQIVFNIAECLFGDFRESYIPMLCERLGIPYTGSGPLTLAICLNKYRAKEILSYHGIPNAKFRVFKKDEKPDFSGFKFPAIAKPAFEGSSKGIFDKSVVDSKKDAKALINELFEKYQQDVILEEFLTGDEFTVALWGNGGDIEVLPIVSINFDSLPKGSRKIYSYEAKWIWDTREKPLDIFQCPAKISAKLKKAIEETAKKTFRAMDVRDWCRIDIRLDSDGVPNVIELNPLPGILPRPEDNSCFPKAARAGGYSYSAFLGNVVKIAAKRQGLEL